MNRVLKFIITLAIVIGGSGLWYNSFNSGPGFGAASAQDAKDVDTSMIAEMSMGNPDASVTVIEYASFTCPHCRNFHANVLGKLKENYIDNGKINFVYREVYFDRFGLWAGMVARCGGDDRYFGIADLLYEQQSDWIAGGDPALVAENLRKIGKTAGISGDDLEACFDDGDTARAMVALYQKNAEADDINSTPSFVINGKKYSNMDYDDFAAVLDEKLAE